MKFIDKLLRLQAERGYAWAKIGGSDGLCVQAGPGIDLAAHPLHHCFQPRCHAHQTSLHRVGRLEYSPREKK